MIKRELAKDPKLANESWDRFLPSFKKHNQKPKKPEAPKEPAKKKVYTPFPPPPQPSKVDLQLESGEYFLKPHERKQSEHAKKMQAQAEHAARREQEREKMFVPPEEPTPGKRKREGEKSDEKESKKSKGDKEKRKEEKKSKGDKEKRKEKSKEEREERLSLIHI